MTGSSFNPEYYFKVLADLIRIRIQAHFDDTNAEILLPDLDEATGPLAEFIKEHNLGKEEHYLLIITLMPHIRPGFFDQIIQDTLPEPGDFPQIGGMRGKQFRGFMPTGETALFLLAGTNWWNNLELFSRVFGPDHIFTKKRVLWLDSPPDGEPMVSGKLVLSQSMITLFTTGKDYFPHFGAQFPAKQLETKMTWNDVVLNPGTRKQLDELRHWLRYSKILMENMGMERQLAPGYRALFYGPPGTGKTLSATLLGKECDKHVLRVDLSTVVSKYIGETEKNLARLFDEAEFKQWILFFDEADAIFGKRTQVKDAHDRYANQEVSYLMQRIESFQGLIILASNLKANMDEAFARRFQSMIFFPYPTPEEQLVIWQKAFPKKLQPHKDVDLLHLAKRYKLTGANIMNVVQYCCLTAMAGKKSKVSLELISHGIQRELQKEGKGF